MNQESKPPCRIQCGNEPDWDCVECRFRNTLKPFNGGYKIEARIIGSHIINHYWGSGREVANLIGRIACYEQMLGHNAWVRFRRVQCKN